MKLGREIVFTNEWQRAKRGEAKTEANTRGCSRILEQRGANYASASLNLARGNRSDHELHERFAINS